MYHSYIASDLFLSSAANVSAHEGYNYSTCGLYI